MLTERTIKLFKSGYKLLSPSIGQLNGLYVYRTDQPNEQLHAIVASGGIPSPQDTNINHFNCSHAHSYNALLRKTTKKIGVKLEGEQAPCSGCSKVKGSRKLIKPYTTSRAVKPGGRMFVNLMGAETCTVIRGEKYMLIVRDDYSKFTKVYFSAVRMTPRSIAWGAW